MISDWALCICLFAVCPIAILYNPNDRKDMTPFEYVFGGLLGLLQSSKSLYSSCMSCTEVLSQSCLSSGWSRWLLV